MTAEMAADSLRGQERGITAFQQSTTIDGQDGDLDSSRGFKCFAWPTSLVAKAGFMLWNDKCWSNKHAITSEGSILVFCVVFCGVKRAWTWKSKMSGFIAYLRHVSSGKIFNISGLQIPHSNVKLQCEITQA